MTIEDPIEFLHRHKKCIVNQREIGVRRDSPSPTALKAALRQDPDVILVGEMRDLETISDRAHRGGDRPPRLRHAAHAGHAADDRPHHRRLPGRAAAADPHAAGGRACRASSRSSCCRPPTAPGRVAACEVLVPTPAVRNLIREGKTHQIYSVAADRRRAGDADDGRRRSRGSCAPGRISASWPSRARPRRRSCAACSAAPAAAPGRRRVTTVVRRRDGDVRLPGDRPRRRPGEGRGRRGLQAGRRRPAEVARAGRPRHQRASTLEGDQHRAVRARQVRRPDDHDAPALDDGRLAA